MTVAFWELTLTSEKINLQLIFRILSKTDMSSSELNDICCSMHNQEFIVQCWITLSGLLYEIIYLMM